MTITMQEQKEDTINQCDLIPGHTAATGATIAIKKRINYC